MTPENRELAQQHAIRDFPRESCGLLIVERGRERYLPCQNIAGGENHFALSPEDYANAEERGEIVGVVHSHPNAPAKPSQADLVACEASGLPWHIVSAPNFAWESIEPSGYKAPLVGREWAHGVLDCYAIVRDYYAEKGVELRDYERNDDWWRLGQNLYLDNFGKEGFKEIPFSELAVGDLILMKMRSQVPNHAAVYLGNNIILHHLSNRLSSRDVYGEYFRRQTHSVLRYDPTQNNHTVR